MKKPDELRSRIMRAVKGKDTQPEWTVRRLLHAAGFRYRLHAKDLPGKPDLVFPARRKIVFVHGCFWHGHDCARGNRQPKTNADYWLAKIARNKARDAEQVAALRDCNWQVLTVWECEIKDDGLLARLKKFLGGRPTGP
jgi:DNA mismatch endonuclease, patch repair protein